MNLDLLNPYQIIQALKEENKQLKAENEELKERISSEEGKE